jgi:hypothetical protein
MVDNYYKHFRTSGAEKNSITCKGILWEPEIGNEGNANALDEYHGYSPIGTKYL